MVIHDNIWPNLFHKFITFQNLVLYFILTNWYSAPADDKTIWHDWKLFNLVAGILIKEIFSFLQHFLRKDSLFVGSELMLSLTPKLARGLLASSSVKSTLIKGGIRSPTKPDVFFGNWKTMILSIQGQLLQKFHVNSLGPKSSYMASVIVSRVKSIDTRHIHTASWMWQERDFVALSNELRWDVEFVDCVNWNPCSLHSFDHLIVFRSQLNS